MDIMNKKLITKMAVVIFSIILLFGGTLMYQNMALVDAVKSEYYKQVQEHVDLGNISEANLNLYYKYCHNISSSMIISVKPFYSVDSKNQNTKKCAEFKDKNQDLMRLLRSIDYSSIKPSYPLRYFING
jgi:hypothetical protein